MSTSGTIVAAGAGVKVCVGNAVRNPVNVGVAVSVGVEGIVIVSTSGTTVGRSGVDVSVGTAGVSTSGTMVAGTAVVVPVGTRVMV